MSTAVPGERLAGVALGVALTQVVAVAIASYAEWPARVGQNPNGLDWIVEGSALSPSLQMWVLLVLVAVLGWSGSRFGVLPVLAGIALGSLAALLIGTYGYDNLRNPVSAGGAPEAVIWVSGLVELALAAALIWAVLHEVWLLAWHLPRQARREARADQDGTG